MHFCMDWTAVNFDWNRARAFLVTAEEGSFSAAARALGASQPTIGRQVGALEAELGVTLFARAGNSLELTAAGLDLVEHVRAMSEAANRISLTAAGQAVGIEGVVRIAASEAGAAYLLPPSIARVRTEYPRIQLELVVSNTASDLLRREADIAMRNFRPKQPDLVARKVRAGEAHMYASPAYLERLGPIEGPADIAGAEILGFDRSTTMIDGLNAMGLPVTEDNFPVITQNHLVQWQLCKQGVGICLMMEQVGDPDPDVCRVLPGYPGIPIPIWLTTHREVRTSRRIRVVYDLLVEQFRS